MIKDVITFKTKEGIKRVYPEKEIVAIKYKHFGEICETAGIIKGVDLDRDNIGSIKVFTFTGSTKVIRDFNVIAIHICNSMEQAMNEIGLFRLIPLEVLTDDTLLSYQKYLLSNFTNEPTEVEWLEVNKCIIEKSLELKDDEFFIGDIVEVNVVKKSRIFSADKGVQRTFKGRISSYVANLFIVLDCSTNYTANKEEIIIKDIVNITKIND